METRYIFYSKRSTFESDKASLKEDQIAFIEETRSIYTHGVEFNCFSESVDLSVVLTKLKFRLNGTTIQYSIDDGETWEKLIDLNDVDWNNVTNLKTVIQNVIKNTVDLTSLTSRVSTLEAKVGDHELRIITLENKPSEPSTGNDYVLPAATTDKLGGIRTGYATSNSARNYAVQLDSNSKAYVNVPWESGGGNAGGGSTSSTKYKAFAFYTVRYENGSYNTTDLENIKKTPSGFTDQFTPTTPSGCTDGPVVKNSQDLIYMTTAWVVDGKLDGDWTPFSLMKDSTEFDVCFNGSETQPLPPDRHGTQNGEGGWYDDVTRIPNGAIWMATSTLNNGVWSEWQVVRIKGENGQAGTSINIVGVLNGSIYTSLAVLTSRSNNEDKNNLSLKDGSKYTSLKTGDCFKVEGGELDGHIVCCHDDTPTYKWVDLGNIQGPAGTSTYVHVKFSNDVQPDETGYSKTGTFTGPYINGKYTGENPGKWMGILVDTQEEDRLDITLYKWSWNKGEDGFGYLYIYTELDTDYINNGLFKTPKLANAIDQNNIGFYSSLNGEIIGNSSSSSLTVHWVDEEPQHLDKYIYRCWVRTDLMDQDNYWNGTGDGKRYPICIYQPLKEPEDGELDLTIVEVYKKGDSSTTPPNPLPSIGTSRTPSGNIIEYNGWNTNADEEKLDNTNKYLWKVTFICQGLISGNVYTNIQMVEPVVARIAGIGVDPNYTGADWVFKGDWEFDKQYVRNSSEIDYVQYGYVGSDGAWYKELPDLLEDDEDKMGYMIQYWWCKKTNTNIEPEPNSDYWEEFNTTYAIASQFATVDTIVTRKFKANQAEIEKLAAGEINADRITSGTITAEHLNIDGIVANNVNVSGVINAETLFFDINRLTFFGESLNLPPIPKDKMCVAYAINPPSTRVTNTITANCIQYSHGVGGSIDGYDYSYLYNSNNPTLMNQTQMKFSCNGVMFIGKNNSPDGHTTYWYPIELTFLAPIESH